MQLPRTTSPVPEHHQARTKALSAIGRKLKVGAASAALILVLGFLVAHHIKSGREADIAEATKTSASALPVVDVITVRNDLSSDPLTLPGETAAWYESVIYARVNGYVGSWSANIGDHVRKGQVLATIDTPDLDAQLAASRAKLKAAQALVVARQADADFAKTTYERWKNSPQGVVSEQERDAKKAGYESAIGQLNEAQAQVSLDQADVERYTALTQFKHVTAPYDGTITERRIDIGNLVTAGSTASTTLLYRIVQDNPTRVFVDVPQSAAPGIKVGLSVRITASNIRDRTFKGKVARTAEAINEQTRTLRVEVDIPNPDHALVSGMYVNVAFEVPSEGLLQVPAAALVFHSDGPQIVVIGKDGKVDFRKVTIARDSGSMVEISSGIAIGDRVGLNISNQITQGETVNAQDASSDSAHVQKQT
ncbi:MAG: efflux RND transporter periplasmic adaptor subunit [candidate division NC10 bacterium]|nr:efflux RND transporter periplasmic adaptor subunit [candidate division NC10 bacterium]MDE2321722.1 efflux RND transporter periplasmic adaptor subunit [candidate division NC10 bacterium]